MKRLTEWNEFGNAGIIALSDMMPEIYAELSFYETNALTEALNRLAAYEDTGLEPDETKKIYGLLSEVAEDRNCHFDFVTKCVLEEGKRIINDPLTLEELREMDGEPVWVVALDYGASRWAFVSADCEVVRYFTTRRGVACDVIGRHFRTYGKTWVAYRRKPEEGMT